MFIKVEKDILKDLDDSDVPYIVVSEFNDMAFKDFYDKFSKMDKDPKVNIIPIIINSYGGSVHNVLSMVDIINSSGKIVATIATGKAMSAGAVLMSAGTKGYRYASENCDIMIHEAASVETGKSTDMVSGAKQLKYLNDKLLKLMGKVSKKSTTYFITELKKRQNIDWFLTARHAKQLGIIDHIGIPCIIRSLEDND